MVPQFLNNQNFPGAIIEYLEATELRDVAGDAFILLVNVFKDSSVDKVSQKFVGQLIKALEFIEDEGTQNALISILILLCCAMDKKLEKTGDKELKNLPLLEFIEKDSFYR